MSTRRACLASPKPPSQRAGHRHRVAFTPRVHSTTQTGLPRNAVDRVDRRLCERPAAHLPGTAASRVTITRNVATRSPLGSSRVSAGAATRPSSRTSLNGWSGLGLLRWSCLLCCSCAAAHRRRLLASAPTVGRPCGPRWPRCRSVEPGGSTRLWTTRRREKGEMSTAADRAAGSAQLVEPLLRHRSARRHRTSAAAVNQRRASAVRPSAASTSA